MNLIEYKRKVKNLINKNYEYNLGKSGEDYYGNDYYLNLSNNFHNLESYKSSAIMIAEEMFKDLELLDIKSKILNFDNTDFYNFFEIDEIKNYNILNVKNYLKLFNNYKKYEKVSESGFVSNAKIYVKENDLVFIKQEINKNLMDAIFYFITEKFENKYLQTLKLPLFWFNINIEKLNELILSKNLKLIQNENYIFIERENKQSKFLLKLKSILQIWI